MAKRISHDTESAPVYVSGGATMAGSNIMTLPIIALAFAVGYLFFKVQAIEKKIDSGVGTVAAGAPSGAPAAPTANYDAMPAVSDKDHILGSKDADVVLVEYSDYQCPFCQRFHPTMQQIVKEYGNKVAWVFRHYPLPFHPYAQKAAEAGECVAKLGGNDKFWKFTDEAFKRGEASETNLSVENLVKLAGEVGVDSGKVKTCIDSGEMASVVKADMDGGSAAGVNGTPGTIMVAKNGKKDFIPGALPFEQVKPMLDKLLQ